MNFTINDEKLLREGRKKLKRISELKENWDSYGAGPIDPRAVEIAEFLLPLYADFSIVPTNEGGIQFERHTKTESIEIEITVSDP